jgi:tetratricopeptide (TPR) repeat protein
VLTTLRGIMAPNGGAAGDPTASACAYADVKPAADPADAAAEWRAERLKDFVWRARCLGMDQDPEVVATIAQMRATTSDLEDMAAAQAAPDYVHEWWKDGEYDEARAEAANDRGMDAFGRKRWAEAFDEYTEAIRLEPRRAGYHANRSAAALKLERHRCAAYDAARAIERDPKHVRAYLRAAAAHLQLREADAALKLYDAALALEPGCAAAAKGKTAAARAAGAAAAERAADADAARIGVRAPLPAAHSWPDLDTAAESLLAAEEVLAHNPNLEGAKAAAVEALVLCGRIGRALELSETMFHDSADRSYLRAEALWRGGELEAALRELTPTAAVLSTATAGGGVGAPLPPAKVVDLGARLTRLHELVSRGVREAEDGQLETAERAFTAALELPDMRPKWWVAPGPAGAGTGAAGRAGAGAGAGAGGQERRSQGTRDPYPNRTRSDVLRRRAAVRIDRAWGGGGDNGGAGGVRGDAASDLDECLAIHPADVEGFMLRAGLKRERGDYGGAFSDLRKAQDAAPETPGLSALVTKAAKMALGASGGAGPGPGGSGGPRGGAADAPEFYRLLGVEQGATAQQVRKGYRKAAAKWHPDKWAAEGGEALTTAEAKFRQVATAYETLGNAHQRRVYDRDPRRFEERSGGD